MQCLEKNTCSIDDDMTEIRKAIQEADILIFASPLYWGSATGLMKTFIDRLFFYYHPSNKPLIFGKKAVIVAPMNQKITNEETKILKEFYNCLLNCLGVEILYFYFFGGIMEICVLTMRIIYCILYTGGDTHDSSKHYITR